MSKELALSSHGASRRNSRRSSALAKLNARDREFLPAALEILETPHSPRATLFSLALCGLATAALAWSYFGRLDVYSTARGSLVYSTKPSVVESLISGTVQAIRVTNGSHVDQGQVLATLNPTEALADEAASASLYDDDRAEAARRTAAIQTAQLIEPLIKSEMAGNVIDPAAYPSAVPPPVRYADDISEATSLRETSVLISDLAQLRATLATIDQQVAQTLAAKSRLSANIEADEQIVTVERGRLDVQNAAYERKVGTKLGFLDAQEALAKGMAQLTSDQGQIAETDAALIQLASQKLKAVDEFIADNQAKSTDAARKADDARQQLAKARSRLQQMELRAPISGTVEQLALLNSGQVVSSGQQTMIITPVDEQLRAQVFVSNSDFGFVHERQVAIIKVDAYPFTQYGVLNGSVERIATDAVTEEDAARLQAHPTALANSASFAGTSPPGQTPNLVFPVLLKFAGNSLDFRGENLPLKSGMSVDVEIKTDSRRIIDYLISPIRKTIANSMHER